MRLSAASPLLLLSLFVAACASGRSGQPIAEFPTAPRLRDLVAAKRQPARDRPTFATLETWHVSSVTSDTLGSQGILADTPWDALLAQLAKGTSAMPTQAMGCVARELAQLELSGKGAADPAFQRFLLARCGAIEEHLETITWRPSLSEKVADAAAFAQLAPTFRAELSKALQGGAGQVGLSFVQSDGKAAIVFARGQAMLDLKASSRLVDSNRVLVLEGKIREPADAISGLINEGKYGVRTCTVDPALALPAFRVQCQLAETDEAAWVSLSITPARRLLSKCVLNVLALQSSDAALTRAWEGEAPVPVHDTASFAASAMELIHRTRAKAGLRPVVQAERQSKTVSELVEPLWLASDESSDEAIEAANEITLGLMAGWDVQGGLIEDADFILDFQGGPPDAARWLADTLEHPMGRKVLLAPDADAIALGAHMPEKPQMLAAVAVNYAFHDAEPSLKARAEDLVERLARVRKARDLGKTTFVTDLPGVEEAVREISTAQTTPADAMQTVMERVSEFSGRPVRGMVWETHDLSEIEFPAELLRYGNLVLGAGVTFYRPAGGAWGQYAVIFVILDQSGGGNT